MADKFKQNRETIGGRALEKAKKGEESGSRELLEKQREFIEGVSEVVEGAENAELTTGEVSERGGEDKKRAGAGTGKSSGTVAMQSQALPELDVMIIQISTKIKKELAALEKERKIVMKNPAKFSPFKLNEIIMRIRELRDILADLAIQTADNIKQLWQRFVKGNK